MRTADLLTIPEVRNRARTEMRKWADIIRADAPKFREYTQQLVDIADALESGALNREVLRLLGKIPVRVQNAVIPMAALSYLIEHRKAYVQDVMNLKTRIAKVHSVLSRHVTAAKSVKVGYKVTVGFEDEDDNGLKITTEEREGEVTVPLSDNYQTFLNDVITAIEEAAGGEFDMDDLDMQPSLLRTFMEGHEPVKHPATAEFYDWVESPFGGGAKWRTGFGTKTQQGFARTPYTWDYYKTTDDFMNTYGHVYVDDENLYDTDEDGNETPKSDEEQAEVIFDYLDPDNHTGSGMLHAERSLLESGDFFLIGYA